MPKFDTFSDALNSENLSVWTKTEVTGGADVTFSSNRLNVRLRSGYPSYQITATNWDLTGSSVFVELVSHPGANAAGSQECIFSVNDTTDAYGYGIIINGNPLVIGAYSEQASGGWVIVGSTISYVNATHRFLRIRESGGTTFFDTSTNASSWTNRWSRANVTGDHTAFRARIQAGDWNADSTNTSVWDNVNLAPAIPSRTTGIRRPTRFFNRKF